MLKASDDAPGAAIAVDGMTEPIQQEQPATGPREHDPDAVTPPQTLTVAGHELTIFQEAPPLVEAMIEDIRRAAKRVWLEMYIILDDHLGRPVAEALKERARAGLDVRLLYDAVGCLSTPAGFFRELEEAGVKVHAFHSLWEAFWRFSLLRIANRRNHRKVLVIDDEVAYFGGMNIGDLSKEGGEPTPYLSTSAGWRDIHVRLAGPQQAEVAESFDRSWRMAHRERLVRRPKAYQQGQLAEGDGESIQFFDSGPGKRFTKAARVFSRLIRAAKRRLVFSMAYFVPTGGVLRELLKAHNRGVFVQVVIPADSDVPIVHHATRYLYRKLLKTRFQLFERQLNMLHSKVMIVDDRWTVLGSANLDPRSLWINLEFMAVVRSEKLARLMSDIARQEIRQSKRVTLKDYLESSWWRLGLDRLAWSFRWWL